ncbi:cation transporter [Novosphingobium sp. PC22D]|uniref:cation diffusion facilitator family transporter n=1 Tax=Novosphingobium sp. PC22D TaxID=1962403 RepID=UPI000BF00BB6|nr:cation diffusion facilitator family transporter [Novosphingobium sp. PC22D]PEQ11048.1 cation transporter [Novosphingobium sp. PC22D]
MSETSGTVTHIRKNIVLYGALVANLAIAVAKFIAAGLSGSSSMMTEGIHSLVDSGNQVLLLYGQKRAARPPNPAHPFGYGRELYFWAFVVAILIFAVGAGVSIYEGVVHIQNPHPIEDPTLNYVVLAIAFALEGTSWTIAVREFRDKVGDETWWEAVRRSKDPPAFIVLFEDSAALIGLVIAAIGVWASVHFGDARIDGAASVAIGLVLATVAILLARESKGLLIGEAADPDLIARLRGVLDGHPAIDAVNHVRTVHTGPESVFVAVSADFADDLAMGEAETLIEEMETRMRAISPIISSIYIRPEKRGDAYVE